MKQIIFAITGASGIIYGKKTLEAISKEYRVSLMISDNGILVGKKELGIELKNHLCSLPNISFVDYKNMDSEIASGFFLNLGMIVCPCSMKTLSAIAQGASENLIQRAADVCLKERKRLILVPRETPLSEIHLENMLILRRMGADIVPAMPGFYEAPKTIDDLVDFIVRKVISLLTRE
ncbi:MAG: UbiX family flavin prenyltransferase [bacterium]